VSSHESGPNWPPFIFGRLGQASETQGGSHAWFAINRKHGSGPDTGFGDGLPQSTVADVILQTASRMVRSTGSAISLHDQELHYLNTLSSLGVAARAAVEVTRSITAPEVRHLFRVNASDWNPILAVVNVPPAQCERADGANGDYNALLVKLFTNREDRWVLSLVRNASDLNFKEHEVNALKSLLPMFEWLLRREVNSALAETGAQGWQILNELRVGVVLAGADGHIAATNRRAMVLLKSHESLSLANGRIGLRRPAENAQFQRSLREIAGDALSGGRSMLVEQENDRGSLLIRFVRLADSIRLCGVRNPSIAIFISDTSMTDRPDPVPLQQLFGLSRIEADVVGLICAGLCPKEAAARLGITPNTVRSYLKSIFRKMGVHRQADLIRVIAASP
jgi:DNA-binding CsgD family transcriptional regulator